MLALAGRVGAVIMASSIRSTPTPPAVPVIASTRQTPTLSVDRARERRMGIPARVRIMAWLVLLLLVALLSVAVVTRNLLLADVEDELTAALVQEFEEFAEFSRVGVNPETGRPFADAGELLRVHLARQRPNDNELLVGVFADGSEPQAQGRSSVRAAVTPEVLAGILASPTDTGRAETPQGPLRWTRTAIDRNTERVDGYFIVGELVAPAQAEVTEAVTTLAAVSAVGLLLAASASWIVAGQILAPIRLVRRAADEITEDDLTCRIPVTGNDDISALAERFNAMIARLEGAFAGQREFVDDAGHELRTPITIIRGNLELMGDDPAERAEVLRLCLDELDRMSRIVEDLLLLAKAERPDFVRPRPVELTELTCDIDAKLRALGPRRWRLESIGEGVILLDAQRVTQAVIQLAHNAVQHTAPGDVISVGSALRGDMAQFWVTDSGPGIPAEDATTIFERFSRGAGGGARANQSGAGLGLAIVRAIAEAHCGWVGLRSVPGQGTTFELSVPVVPPHCTSAAAGG